MHLLLIHNNYGVHSGEETVVDQQIALFRQAGHQVSVYRKTTEGVRGTVWGNLKGLLQGFYSPPAVKDINRIMKTDKPDVVIIHNLYPYISPAILSRIKKANVPIVMTIHNYRLMCPTGLFMRNSLPCELCLGGREWNCIKHNCENSYSKSWGYAARNRYARVTKAYINHVDSYACITQFQIQKLTQAGYDKNKMRHIPNFLEKPEEPTYSLGDYVAVCGRLSKEKGIDLILEAAARTPTIRYVFAGTQRTEEPVATPRPDNCLFAGHLSGEQLAVFYKNARFLVIASRCYEGFPMTILEAASYGKPAVAPNHGGFTEIIGTSENAIGKLFRPNDASDLQKNIIELWNHPETIEKLGKKAFEKWNAEYSSTVVSGKWNNLLKSLFNTK